MAQNQEIRWYDADLSKRLRMGYEYVCGILNPDQDNWPYFFYARYADGTAGGAGGLDALPHAVGRAMELLLNYEKNTGEKPPMEVEEAYFRHFFEYMDADVGISTYPDAEAGRPLIHLHNLRETIEAFALLIELRDDDRARQLVEALYTGLEQITDQEAGAASLEKARQTGVADKFQTWSLVCEQPQTMGRLTGPLMQLYRVTGDKRALHWASCFAKGTMNCFTEEGAFLSSAGTHVHSITSSMSGAADYAYSTGDSGMLEKLQRVLVHPEGLGGISTSYGWIKEQVHVPDTRQGECNQIGDIIQLRMIMAQYEKPAYWYGTAEIAMRSMLLPSQVLSADFIREKETVTCDADRDMKRRVRGGFGFPMPSAHLEWDWSAINSLDITQGSCQAITAFTNHIAVREADTLWVHLLFTHTDSEAEIYSELPVTGYVSVLPKKSGSVRIRIPGNIDEDSLEISIRGKTAAYERVAGYMVLPDVPAGARIEMKFRPELTERKEQVLDVDYTVQWFGEQVISVTPVEGLYPLYDGFPLPQNRVFHKRGKGGQA